MVRMTQALNPETKVEAPAATDTPLVTEKPKYTPLYDWSSGMSMADAYKQGKHNRGDILRDRERWGKENDNPVNILEAMDMVPENYDPRKTYQENELEEKRRKRQENWEKIGNFLSHLGNFIGTTAFGAPSQTLEPAKELSARQQAMRDKTEALRTAYNNNFFEAYNKQRAMDRQAELDKQNADYRNEQLKISNEGLKLRQQAEDRRATEMWLNNDIKNRRLTLDEAKLKLKEAIDRGRLTVAQGNLALQELKAGGYTVETTEQDGKKIQKKTLNRGNRNPTNSNSKDLSGVFS